MFGRGRSDGQILVAQADDGHDGAAAVGFDDRVDARIEPRADQRADAGQGHFLELGIGQVDHLGHEVARHHLVEVFVGEFDRDGVVGQEGLGTRHGRANFQGREEFHPRTTGDVGQLQPIHGALREVVASGRDELFGVETPRSGHVPLHGEPFRTHEVDLRRGRHWWNGRLVRKHAGTRAVNAWPRMRQHL